MSDSLEAPRVGSHLAAEPVGVTARGTSVEGRQAFGGAMIIDGGAVSRGRSG